MDKDIEKLYALLDDSNFPLTDLKNPSSDFMIKFSLHFLAQHSIDGKAIQRETEEQRQVLTFPELYSDMIVCVNLHDVMAKLGARIFVRDLYLTDFLTPGAKRTRRIISTFCNFALYASNKIDELNDPLNVIFSRSNTYNTHVEKKQSIINHRVDIVLENSKKIAQRDQKLAMKKKCKEQFLYTNNDIEATMHVFRKAEEDAQQVLGRTMSLREQVLKEREATTKLESHVVKSPEEYRVKLVSLQQKRAEKEAIKIEVYQRIQEKRRMIEQLAKSKEVVQQQHQKFPQLQTTYQRFKAANKRSEKLLHDLNDVNVEIENLKAMNDPNVISAEELKTVEVDQNCKRRLAPTFKIRDELQCKKREVNRELEEAQFCRSEMDREKIEVCALITVREKETQDYLEACQERYDREIAKEACVQRCWNTEMEKMAN